MPWSSWLFFMFLITPSISYICKLTVLAQQFPLWLLFHHHHHHHHHHLLPGNTMFFLSFRGEDTCKNFINHQYFGSKQKEIFTFRDDKKTQVGNIHCPKTLESNRRIEVCCRNSIKRLRYFKVVLD